MRRLTESDRNKNVTVALWPHRREDLKLDRRLNPRRGRYWAQMQSLVGWITNVSNVVAIERRWTHKARLTLHQQHPWGSLRYPSQWRVMSNSEPFKTWQVSLSSMGNPIFRVQWIGYENGSPSKPWPMFPESAPWGWPLSAGSVSLKKKRGSNTKGETCNLRMQRAHQFVVVHKTLYEELTWERIRNNKLKLFKISYKTSDKRSCRKTIDENYRRKRNRLLLSIRCQKWNLWEVWLNFKQKERCLRCKYSETSWTWRTCSLPKASNWWISSWKQRRTNQWTDHLLLQQQRSCSQDIILMRSKNS